MSERDFAAKIIAWQRTHGRHDLPWQGTRDPYLIWLAEIMLQQTQVSAVIPYYQRFLVRFPTIAQLAAGTEDEVLQLWSGLGYYSRARNLHRTARIIAADHGGRFPDERDRIEALPGIGRSTAAAIAAFAFGQRGAILDGNVKRVLARCFTVAGFPGERAVEQALWSLAESLLPRRGIEAYTQGLMDLGATRCLRTRPRCGDCPVHDRCGARAQDRIGTYPGRRARKVIPQRQTHLLVLRRNGELMLEKRPALGIWGGLWCFPEVGERDDAARDLNRAVQQICRERFGCEARSVQRMPRIAHGFTHFSLDIDPLLVEVGTYALRASEPGTIWLPTEEARKAALPVPAKKIIATLLGDQALLFEEPVEDL